MVKEQLKPLLLLQEEAVKDWGDVELSNNAQHDSVVVGLAPDHFHYQKMNEAFQLLKQGARLVAINKSRGNAEQKYCIKRNMNQSLSLEVVENHFQGISKLMEDSPLALALLCLLWNSLRIAKLRCKYIDCSNLKIIFD